MDGNKDEAMNCLKIGKDALAIGDRIRALKFISKARQLYPNLSVDDDLLASLGKDSGVVPPPTSHANAQVSAAPTVNASESSTTVCGSSKKAKSFTEEQMSIVRTIMEQKDSNAILGVEKNCSAEDVRKAYRKLSLKVHPDKNHAPGAEDAFKFFSRAFQCLSNQGTIMKYHDLFERPEAGGGHQNHHKGFKGPNEAKGFEKKFRNFFCGEEQPRWRRKVGIVLVVTWFCLKAICQFPSFVSDVVTELSKPPLKPAAAPPDFCRFLFS